jgi:hypothetical protein
MKNKLKNSDEFNFSHYWIVSILLLFIPLSLLIFYNSQKYFDNLIINLIIWLLFLIIWIILLVSCLKDDVRKEFGKVHAKEPLFLILFLYIFTFDLALLMAYWIQFPNTTFFDYFKYSEIFTTLITIHATILSIVITLTIISIQLNTEKYSFDMIEFFKDLYEIWVIFIIYMIAIYLDLLALTNSSLFIWILNIEFCLIFGIFAILSLFPFIWMMLALMRPENLIQRHVNNKSILNLNDIIGILEVGYIAIKRSEIGIVGVILGVIEFARDENKIILQNITEKEFLKLKNKWELDEIINLLNQIEKINVNSMLIRKRINQLKEFFAEYRYDKAKEIDDEIDEFLKLKNL